MKKILTFVMCMVLLSCTFAFAKGGGGFGGGGGRSFGGGGFKSSGGGFSSSKSSGISTGSSKSISTGSTVSRPSVGSPLAKSSYMPSRSVMPASRAGRALPSYVAASRSYRGAPVYYSQSDSGSSMMPFFLGMYLGSHNNHGGNGVAQGQNQPNYTSQGGEFAGGGAGVNIDDFGSMVLSRRINDFAHVLTEAQESALNAQFAALEQISSNQVVIVTVPSLQGKNIQEVALESAKLWKIGTEENNNGILILMAVAEKQIRIEVGRGLEGAYPDIAAKHVLEAAGPLFVEKKYAEGLNLIAKDIVEKTKNEYDAKKTALAQAEKREKEVEEATFTVIGWIVGLGVLVVICMGIYGHFQSKRYF